MIKNRIHMQINQVSNQLKALISEKHLIKLAKASGFQARHLNKIKHKPKNFKFNFR